TNNTATAISNRLLFTARDRDPDTGLYNYRYRYYSPSLGRFVQPDPIGFTGGANFYLYVRNRPVNRTDSFGLATNKLIGPDGTTYDVDPLSGRYTIPSTPTKAGPLGNFVVLSVGAIGVAVIAADFGPEAALFF